MSIPVRFTITADEGLESLLGYAAHPSQVFSCDFLVPEFLEKINSRADAYQLTQVPPSNAKPQRVPAHLEQEFRELASSDEEVMPTTDGLGLLLRVEEVKRLIANGASEPLALAVRAFALPPEVAAKLLRVPVEEAQVLVRHGLYEPDCMGRTHEAETLEKEQADAAARTKAAKQAKRLEEVVTFAPKDFGLACFVVSPGPLPGSLGPAILAFEAGGGVMGPGGFTPFTPRIRKTGYVFIPALPEVDYPEQALNENVRLLASDATVQMPRGDMPKQAGACSCNLDIWSDIFRSRAIDRSAMGEPIDLRDPRSKQSAEQIREYLKRHAKESRGTPGSLWGPGFSNACHIERVTRGFGALTTNTVLSLLREAGWVDDGNEEHVRLLIERYQTSGEFIGKCDYPVTQEDTADAWVETIRELLLTSPEPQGSEVIAWCEARGLKSENGHAGAQALRSMGYERKRLREQGERVVRWVKAGAS
jgi:hypothetical protein